MHEVFIGSSPSSTPFSPLEQSSSSNAPSSPLEQSFDNPVSPEDSLHPLPIPHHEVSEAQPEQSLFQQEADTANQMEALIESAWDFKTAWRQKRHLAALKKNTGSNNL